MRHHSSRRSWSLPFCLFVGILTLLFSALQLSFICPPSTLTYPHVFFHHTRKNSPVPSISGCYTFAPVTEGIKAPSCFLQCLPCAFLLTCPMQAAECLSSEAQQLGLLSEPQPSCYLSPLWRLTDSCSLTFPLINFLGFPSVH